MQQRQIVKTLRRRKRPTDTAPLELVWHEPQTGPAEELLERIARVLEAA